MGVVYPIALFVYPLILIAFGFLVGFKFKKWRAEKKLGMTIEEAAERRAKHSEDEAKLGMTIEQAAEKLAADPPIKAADVMSLSDECKTMLLYAYGKPNGFPVPNDPDTFPDAFNYLALLKSRRLATELPKNPGMFAQQNWIITRKAREFLDANEDVMADVEVGKKRNDAEAIERRDQRLYKGWEDLPRAHKLVVYKEYLEKDDETHLAFQERPEPSLARSAYLFETGNDDDGYTYDLRDGVAELLEGNPDLLCMVEGHEGDIEWIAGEINGEYRKLFFAEEDALAAKMLHYPVEARKLLDRLVGDKIANVEEGNLGSAALLEGDGLACVIADLSDGSRTYRITERGEDMTDPEYHPEVWNSIQEAVHTENVKCSLQLSDECETR